MDLSNEKFFEALAQEKLEADAGFEVGLAKASSTEPEIDGETGKTAIEKSKNDFKAPKKNRDDEPEGQLAIDVYQTPADIIVESAIAGVKPEDIDINVTSDSVTIKGERRREEELKGDDYYYQECYWGRFSRSVILPQEIDPERAEVTFKNGILTVRLPKANKKRQRKLKIKTE